MSNQSVPLHGDKPPCTQILGKNMEQKATFVHVWPRFLKLVFDTRTTRS
jgi:hypothetical protein